MGKLGLEAVGGPIRIGQVAGEMLRWSFGHLMQFIAFFSVNLFLLNMLPIPVLDGGHLIFLFLEGLRGRPLGLEVRQRLTMLLTEEQIVGVWCDGEAGLLQPEVFWIHGDSGGVRRAPSAKSI